MLRLRRLTDYGTVILAQLAAVRVGWMTVSSIAQATRIPEATVGKLLKQLTHEGLVVSQRGTHGGYRLARDPEHISALEILESLEGNVAVTECSPGSLGCDHARYCRARTPWQTINEALRRTLAVITLAELAAALPIVSLDPAGRPLVSHASDAPASDRAPTTARTAGPGPAPPRRALGGASDHRPPPSSENSRHQP